MLVRVENDNGATSIALARAEVRAHRLSDALDADAGSVGELRSQCGAGTLVDAEARRLLGIEPQQIVSDGIEQGIRTRLGGGIGG